MASSLATTLFRHASMALGSRKKKRPGGRNVSPPLAPSPLLTRNLQLLPVGLTQLPNDEAFVAQLRSDVNDLLSTFAEALLLKILKHSETTSRSTEAGPSSQTIESGSTAEHVVSPFSVFVQVWRQKGWHYVQFAFADHNDSKRAIGDAICRVLLEHLEPYAKQHHSQRSRQDQQVSGSLTFANLGQLFKVMAVPFALYLFWSTQIYPTSGIGVKHCRPAMERIPIEQDYYDCLLDVTEAVLKHLKDVQQTARSAEAIAADLGEVLCRLVGQPFDVQSLAQDSYPAPAPPPTKVPGQSKGRQAWQDGVNAGDHLLKAGSGPVFDIIPPSSHSTRMPRNWPSVRVMSSLEANKEFGRIGTVVRINSTKEPCSTMREAGSTSTTETREAVAGLSRGDVVRLKARQRLASTNLTIAKLLGQHSATDSASSHVGTSDLLAQTGSDAAQPGPSTRAVRYEIETPRWISSAKYTSKLQPWLEPVPVHPTQQRSSFSKKRYRESRDEVMQAERTGADTDYGEWILNSFREERRALQTQQPADTRQAGKNAVRSLPDINDSGTLSLDALYRLAAERTKTAAVERGEMLKGARAGTSRSK